MRDSDDGQRLLTTSEVKARLLADPRLRGVATTCALPAVRVGAEWRIRRADLEAWIAGFAFRAAVPAAAGRARPRIH
jgi:hypothetical protein